MTLDEALPARIPTESRVRVRRPTGEWVTVLVTSAIDLSKPGELPMLTLQRPLFIGAPRLRERLREVCHETFEVELLFRTGDKREYGVRSAVTFTGSTEGLMIADRSVAVDVLSLPVLKRLAWGPSPDAWDGDPEL